MGRFMYDTDWVKLRGAELVQYRAQNELKWHRIS